MFRLAAAAAFFACVVSAAAEIPGGEFAARRQALRKGLRNSVLVLFGNTNRDVDDLRTGFYQEPNFYYVTGWTEPGAIVLLTADAEILFIPSRNEAVERYTGAKVAADDANATKVAGFEQVLPLAQFESQFVRALEKNENVLTLTNRRRADELARLAPMRQISDATRMLARRRAKKSEAEIELIRKAAEVSMEAHRAAWRRIEPGVYEYQAAATMVFAMQDRNCRPAYALIVASGPNSPVLHYSANSRKIEAGEVVVMDVGAACADYAFDITRTVPASGKFTPRQREIYEAVLGAQRAAIDAIKPGATMQSINKAARAYLEEHGKLGKYLTHGISHGVGLEVHDSPSHVSTEPFEAGMVITVEPGVYLPEEKFGIRIEDTVLVTEKGAEVLSAALPKDPADIEKAIARK